MARFLVVAILLSTFCFPRATAGSGGVTNPSALVFISQSSSTHDIHNSFAPMSMLETILANRGFQEISMAAPYLSYDSAFTTRNDPITLIAPSDAWICSDVRIVPFYLFKLASGTKIEKAFTTRNAPNTLIAPSDACICFDVRIVPCYLYKLASGTKIETTDPRRNANFYSNMFIQGVEIMRSDLSNNGLVVVHGLQCYVAPLSCSIESVQHPAYIIEKISFGTLLAALEAGRSLMVTTTTGPSMAVNDDILCSD
ncbi:hypothetical protein L1987_21190 [Smallanthus sonchifolius]|uniref:Uncharacterized protein n=1 Tax=Smallanthus sonchifolius TaxID=185202 RepID=A0ACB9IVF4_9ASTR|nr:hypothetical protein L1987_21190 [Smallanthus sonchifolius]